MTATASGHLPSAPRILLLAGDLAQAETAGLEATLPGALSARGSAAGLLALSRPPAPIAGAELHLARGPRLPRLAGAPSARRLLENVPLLDAATELLRTDSSFTAVVALRPEHATAARSLGLPFVVVLGGLPQPEGLDQAALVLPSPLGTGWCATLGPGHRAA